MTTTGRPYRKRCPRCKRTRRFSGGRYSSDRRHRWGKIDGVLVCPWCIDPEEARHSETVRRAAKKARRKKDKAAKVAPFVWDKKR